MAYSNKNITRGIKFPICIPIAIIMGLTHHIFLVSNIQIQEKHFVEKQNISEFDKKHLLVFSSPKKNSSILHFFPYEQWNSYYYSDRLSYTPLIINNLVNIEGLKYKIPTDLGTIDFDLDCEIKSKDKILYEVVCNYKNQSNSKENTYTYAYKYKFNSDLSVKISDIHYSHSRNIAQRARDIQPDIWVGFIFYGILSQYLFIPLIIQLKRRLRRVWDNLRGNPNYDNLPPMRVKANDKKYE